MMHTQMDFTFWKGRTEIFFRSALNHDKFLNENEYKAFDIYRECSYEVFSFY